MRGSRARSSWGFAINYDREIKADLAALEDAERCLARQLLKPADHPVGHAFSIVDAALAGGEWLARLEITDADRHDLAWLYEISDERCAALKIPLTAPTGDWYRRATAIEKRLAALTAWSDDLLTEERAKAHRSKAKADLARHRRNKLKHGRS